MCVDEGKMSREAIETAAEKGPAALLIIDLINDYDFGDSDLLYRFVPEVAEKIAALKERLKKQGSR